MKTNYDEEIMDKATNCVHMTNEEHGQFLRILIRNTEARYIDYTKTMEQLYKDRPLQNRINELQELLNTTQITQEEFDKQRIEWIDLDVWYKGFLRECKNNEAIALKGLREEQKYHNQGLNPPSCYPYRNQNEE